VVVPAILAPAGGQRFGELLSGPVCCIRAVLDVQLRAETDECTRAADGSHVVCAWIGRVRGQPR